MVPVNLDDGRPFGVSDRAELLFLVRGRLTIGAHPQVQRNAMRSLNHHAGNPLRASITFPMWFLSFQISTVYCTSEGVSKNRMFSGGGKAGFCAGFLYPPSRREIGEGCDRGRRSNSEVRWLDNLLYLYIKPDRG